MSACRKVGKWISDATRGEVLKVGLVEVDKVVDDGVVVKDGSDGMAKTTCGDVDARVVAEFCEEYR